MQITVSLEQLDSLANKFWNEVGRSKVFCFYGEMGAGKTTIVEALCRYKGVKDKMSSPTFSIINEYGYEEDKVVKKIYHIDLYRLNDEEEIRQAGVEDCLYSGAICFVEWPQKAPAELYDENSVDVVIKPLSDTERLIEIVLPAAE